MIRNRIWSFFVLNAVKFTIACKCSEDHRIAFIWFAYRHFIQWRQMSPLLLATVWSVSISHTFCRRRSSCHHWSCYCWFRVHVQLRVL